MTTATRIEVYDHARDMIRELLTSVDDISVEYDEFGGFAITDLGPRSANIVEKHIRAAIEADRGKRSADTK